MPKGKKSTEPREPILIVPYKKGDYPRAEVFADKQSVTIGVRKNAKETNLSNIKYCSPTPKSILKTLDKLLFSEKISNGRSKEYEPIFEDFMNIIKEHNKFMEDLAKEVKK